ncbi:MAG: TonB-dependent receptor [Pseudomonadota bacterium]|nr:TonB-dependent receptor [Pseudomonadota bacterium]
MKNFTLKPLAAAISSVGLATALAGPGLVWAEEEAIEEVEEVVVTGSRIQRTENTQSRPVVTITGADLIASGAISVADALRDSALNSLGSFRESSGNSAQSNAYVSLRGAGASRTLVLLNGRRAVGSPSLGGGGIVNLNMLPLETIDRIEIIPDGASAVYGSDAVAGVINVILKDEYEGFRMKARYGSRGRDDGEETGISLLTGASTERGSFVAGFEHDSRDPIFDADRKFTAASKNDANGDGVIQGYQETVGISIYGYTLLNPNYNGLAYDPDDNDTWRFHPGANCSESDGFQGPMQYFGSGQYCGYAYALVSANRASLDRTNAWISADYELTDNTEVFFDLVWTEVDSFGRYAPPAAPGPVIPGDPRNQIISPTNGVTQATDGYFRWTDIGFRDNNVQDTFIDINAGAKGTLSDNVSWEAYATVSKYKSASIGQYYLSYAGLDVNINDEVDDFDEFVANMKHTTLNDDQQTMKKFFVGAQWDMFDMAGGTASSYFALEQFEVNYAALVDAQSEAGLVGGSAGNSAKGNRSVTAFAAETILPVTDWMEIDAAVRYDQYSDVGSAVTPRVGVTAQIPQVPALTLRASYGEGFRAPDLSDLFGATAFSASGGIDYYGCQIQGIDLSECPSQQFNTYIGSNPNLDPEKSSSMSFGIEYDITDTWQAALTYFKLELEDTISLTGAQDQLDVDFQTGGNNPLVQRIGSSVIRIDAGFQNAVVPLERDGIDLNVNGLIETGYGSFTVGGEISHYLTYDEEVSYGTGDLTNAAGTLGFTKWMATALVGWSMNDYSASLSWRYVGASESNVSDEEYPQWDTFNARVGYSMGEKGSINLAVRNLFDRDPLLRDGQMANEYLYDLTGRVISVSYVLEM